MPYVPPDEVARRKERVLSFAPTCRDLTDLCTAAGISKNTVVSWRRRDAGFKRAMDSMLGTGLRPRAEVVGGFPDFLTFREMFFKRKNFWYHQEAYHKVEGNDRLIMLVPPAHAKTTTWSIEYATYRIMRDQNVRILILQANEEDAADVIFAVQERLTNHEFYENLGVPREENPITLYGGTLGFKGKHWGRFSFRVPGANLGEKEFTMQAKGIGSKIYGKRLDLIMCDDIQDPLENTPGHVDKLMHLIHHVLLSRWPPGEKGKFIALGTRVGPADMWDRLMDMHPNWEKVEYPAVLDFDKQTLLCPDLWTWDRLMGPDGVREEVGDAVWATAWMQEEVDPEAVTFRRDLMERALDDSRYLGQKPDAVTHIAVGVDPAIKGYCAIVTWGLDIRTGKRYLIDVFNRRGLRHFPNVTKEVTRHINKYRPQGVVIETGRNIQSGFIHDPDLRKAAAAMSVPLFPYVTATETGARAEARDFDISSVGALYDEGLVSLPAGDEQARRAMKEYIDQHVAWLPGVKHLVRDMVMATLFAESLFPPWLQAARREAKPRKSRAPGWATNGEGGFRWKGRVRRWGVAS